jgi:hypothetical protein
MPFCEAFFEYGAMTPRIHLNDLAKTRRARIATLRVEASQHRDARLPFPRLEGLFALRAV